MLQDLFLLKTGKLLTHLLLPSLPQYYEHILYQMAFFYGVCNTWSYQVRIASMLDMDDVVADDFSVNKIFTTSGVLFALIRKLRKLIFRKKNCRLQFACQPWTCTVSCMLTRGSFLRATISALNYELFPWIEYMYYFLLQLGKEIYNVDIHSYFPLTRLNYTLNAF